MRNEIATAAVDRWNNVSLGRAIDTLRAQGEWISTDGSVEMDGPRCGIGVPRRNCQASKAGTIHLYSAISSKMPS